MPRNPALGSRLPRLYYLGSRREAEQVIREGTKSYGSAVQDGQRGEEHLPLPERFQAGLLFYARGGIRLEAGLYSSPQVTGHVGDGGAAYSQ